MMYCCPNAVDLNELDGKDISDIGDYNKQLPDKPTGMSGENSLTKASVEMGKLIIEKMGDLIGLMALKEL